MCRECPLQGTVLSLAAYRAVEDERGLLPLTTDETA
jgi:hypothetical protein